MPSNKENQSRLSNQQDPQGIVLASQNRELETLKKLLVAKEQAVEELLIKLQEQKLESINKEELIKKIAEEHHSKQHKELLKANKLLKKNKHKLNLFKSSVLGTIGEKQKIIEERLEAEYQERLNAIKERLESQYSGISKENRKLFQELKEEKERSATLQEKNKGLVKDNYGKDKQIEETTKKLKESQKRKGARDAQSAKYQLAIRDLKKQLKKSSDDNQLLNNGNVQLKKQAENQQKEFEKEFNKRVNETAIPTLHKIVEKLRQENEALKEKESRAAVRKKNRKERRYQSVRYSESNKSTSDPTFTLDADTVEQFLKEDKEEKGLKREDLPKIVTKGETNGFYWEKDELGEIHLGEASEETHVGDWYKDESGKVYLEKYYEHKKPNTSSLSPKSGKLTNGATWEKNDRGEIFV